MLMVLHVSGMVVWVRRTVPVRRRAVHHRSRLLLVLGIHQIHTRPTRSHRTVPVPYSGPRNWSSLLLLHPLVIPPPLNALHPLPAAITDRTRPRGSRTPFLNTSSILVSSRLETLLARTLAKRIERKGGSDFATECGERGVYYRLGRLV